MNMKEINKSDICSPITDLGKVLSWECDKQCWIHFHDVENISKRSDYLNTGYYLDVRSKTEVFSEYRLWDKNLPKTIFCHDYKGGYVEDRFCNGSPEINTYRFFNWAGIDLFIYFSHQLVTIPPQGWLNAGHLHGVPVLGTLITEWDEGNRIWIQVLEDLDKINLFSRKLAEICAHFKFDGYLLNVENEIPKQLIPRLVQFVALLKANLDLYCRGRTWLIWYDSVTSDGELKWQNKLCSINKCFFDACDGMFLNYCWTPADLQESLAVAGERRHDVFVGVDVWGRNCYQDGGFSVDKVCFVQAMAILRSLNMSVALFACGWTFETLSRGEDFLCKEEVFWRRFWPSLYVHGPAQPPFSTNFCQGVSYNKTTNNPLFNLGMQQYQPTAQACCADTNIGNSCIALCMEDGLAYNGACLKVSASSKQHSQLFHRVLVSDFRSSKGKSSRLVITLALKPQAPDSKFRIYFVLEDVLGVEGKQKVSMMTRPKGYRATVSANYLLVSGSVVDFTTENQTSETKIQTYELCSPLPDSWSQVKFLLTLNADQTLTEVLLLPPATGSVLWGLLSIEELKDETNTIPSGETGNS